MVRKAGYKGEQRLRFQLSLEEILLDCREQCGEGDAVTLCMKRRGRQLNTVLILPAGYAGESTGGESPMAALVSQWKAGTAKRRPCRTYGCRFSYVTLTGLEDVVIGRLDDLLSNEVQDGSGDGSDLEI